MKHVLLVFGTRPEAIKMCPLVQELCARTNMVTRTCVTGQHRDMIDQVLEAFDIVPDYDLNIMSAGQSLADITIKTITGISNVLDQEKPDIVLVHGDTTTAFASALACFYKQVPIGHVEAGLRTYQMKSPFPEEMNRQAIDLISDYYFAPTEVARTQLTNEGKPENRIFVTGNTAIDALRTTVRPDYSHEHLTWAEESCLVMITAHRRENLGEPMQNMFRAIRRIVEEHPQIKAIYPVHLNPAVRKIAGEELDGCERIRLIDPLDVIDFHNFMAHSYIILTDSGGIQEEAPSLGKPVLVMRDTTERPEGIAAGTLKLVGTNETQIYQAFKELIDDTELYRTMSQASNPYGDGFASRRIADIIEKI